MKNFIGLAALLILCVGSTAFAQVNRREPAVTQPAASVSCQLAGAYRIDIAQSDKLYSVVKDATSLVPFGSQQQFFMDLSIRLTPPDLLAIECNGSRVSVASSRAAKVSFVADGRMKRETKPNGGVVISRVLLDHDTLTFRSQGKADDNVDVAFHSLKGGSRLSVTRRIDAEQLTQPIIIRTFYDKIAERVDWNLYGGDQIARQPAQHDNQSTLAVGRPASRTKMSDGNDPAVLRRTLDEWIDATNERDLQRQMTFYTVHLKAFYLSRNTPRSAVRQEKQRIFHGVSSVSIRAEAPEILFQDNGHTAIMRFNKKYRIAKNANIRTGEVIQELRWQRTPNGWRIFSERDIRVIR